MIRNGYQHMVIDDYVRQLRTIRAQRLKRLQSLRSAEDVLAYQKQAQAAIDASFAPRPERCDLNPQILGELQRGDVRVEKLTFESRPNFLVTANLYLPTNLDKPAPAVLGTCGHSMEGKAAAVYSAFAERLARNGFVVLIYEPCNQGERDQYSRLENRSCVQNCCNAHNMMGKQMELVGDFYGMWRTWDGIRALDYLLSRPEVDPKHVGVTGNSGGGTMTTWLWGAESRFTMAAPSCFPCTFMRNLENELPADNEQCPPGIIGAGCEHTDFMIVRAPKPVIILGQKYDFFDRRGVDEVFTETQRIYELLGAGENCRKFIGPTTHGYSDHNQQAMLDFFCEQVKSGPVTGFEIETPPTLEELQVTPKGDVVAAGSTPIYELTDARAEELEAQRPTLSGKALQDAVRAVLQIQEEPAETPYFRALRGVRVQGETHARYAVETEREIRAILRKRMQMPAWTHSLDVAEEVLLYVPHVSAEEELPSFKPGFEGELYAVDVRGKGESATDAPGQEKDYLEAYGMEYLFHAHGLMLGESYLGRRVFDLLRTIDLLNDNGAKVIRLHGRGQGAILALFAAMLRPGIASLEIENAPLSFRDWTRSPLLAWPVANIPRNVLQHFDIPDCVRDLGNKVEITAPWGADMQPCDLPENYPN